MMSYKESPMQYDMHRVFLYNKKRRRDAQLADMESYF